MPTARRRLMIRSFRRSAAICEAAVGAVALLIVELFPNALINVFGAANESVYYTEFAVKAFRMYDEGYVDG